MGLSVMLIPGESDPPKGLFAIDFHLTHPFDEHPEFTAFDVKGIVMVPGTLEAWNSWDHYIFPDTEETRLENADGYTRWWNPTEFTSPGIFGYTDGLFTNTTTDQLTANFNPYKYFADCLGPTDDLTALSTEPLDSDIGRGLFSSGTTNTRRYYIRFPMNPDPVILFGYVIDGCWEIPDPVPPAEVPDDFPMEANQPEAYDVQITPVVNRLYYDSEVGAGGGVLQVRVDVADWQGRSEGDVADDIGDVRLIIPALADNFCHAQIESHTSTHATYFSTMVDSNIPVKAGTEYMVCLVQNDTFHMYIQSPEPAPPDLVRACQVIELEIIDPDCFADSDNSFAAAQPVDLEDMIEGQFCNPDDPEDYYSFEIPQGYITSGEIRLWANSEPPWPINPQLILYDSFEKMIHTSDVLEGQAVINLDCLDLMPGKHYLKAVTTCTNQVIPYLLELEVELEYIAPENPVDVTPSDLYVDPDYVFVEGDYAYLLGQGLWVYEISDPVNPEQVFSDVYQRRLQHPCFHWPYCYYSEYMGSASNYQLNLIDFSDPASPVVHENIFNYIGEPGHSAIDQTHLYVEFGTGPDYILNIFEYAANPLSPAIVGSIPISWQPTCIELTESPGFGTYLLVGQVAMIHCFWVEDPSSISEYTPYPIAGGEVKSIAANGNFCYLAVEKAGSDGWLYVLDFIQGLDGFNYYGSVDIPGEAEFIRHQAQNVFIADGSAGLTVCDISIPTLPDHLGTSSLVSEGVNLTIDGDEVYIIPEHAGLQVFDVSVPNAPDQLSRLKVVNHPTSIDPLGDYLLVTEYAGEHKAFKTVDISDPSSAHVVDEYFLSQGPWYIDRDGTHAVLLSDNCWYIFDVSNPLDLNYINTVPFTGNPFVIGINNDAVYLANDVPEVKVYDIGNLPSVTAKPSFTPPDVVTGFEFYGNYMYLNTTPGIQIYNISDPFNPVHSGLYMLSPSTQQSVIEYGYLYMLTGFDIEVADLSSPISPVYLGECSIGAPSLSVMLDIDGQFGYTGAFTSQPAYACGLWPLDNPWPIGALHDNEIPVVDIEAHNGYFYEVSMLGGVRIYDLY